MNNRENKPDSKQIFFSGIFSRKAILMLTIYFIIGIVFILLRPSHSDEGYYLLAAKNVSQGMQPYVDFVYHQAPLMPYIYSPFSDFGFLSCVLLRSLSFMLTFALAIILYLHVFQTVKNKEAATFALLLLVFNGLFIDWNSIIRMFALANLCCYISFYLAMIIKFDRSKADGLLVFLAGLFVGISINLRFTYSGCMLLLLGYVLYNSYKKRIGVRSLIVLALFLISGFIIPSLPSLYFLVSNFERFTFEVFILNVISQKSVWVINDYMLRWVKFVLMPQNIILLSIIFFLRNKTINFLALGFIIFLIIFNAPGFFINDYLNVIIPYLVFLCGINYDSICDKFKSFRWVSLKGLSVIYIISFFLSVPYFLNYFEKKTFEPDLVSLSDIVKQIESLPGEKIISSWDIYPALTNKNSGTIRNIFVSSFIGENMVSSELSRYSIPDSLKLNEAIEKQYFDIVVLNLNTPFGLKGQEEVIRRKYIEKFIFGNTIVFGK